MRLRSWLCAPLAAALALLLASAAGARDYEFQCLYGMGAGLYRQLLATPGIAYVTYHFEVAIGTQFALNQASVRGTHAAVVGLLDIFYDSIFPKVGNWTINRGFGG